MVKIYTGFGILMLLLILIGGAIGGPMGILIMLGIFLCAITSLIAMVLILIYMNVYGKEDSDE